MMGYRTKQKEILERFFEGHHHGSFTVEEIFAAVGDQGISLSAIYRNLAELEKEGGLLKTTPQGSTKAHYQYVGCEHCKGHIHMHCIECGKTTHLPDNGADKVLADAYDASGFEIDPTTTVLYGVCKECAGHHGGHQR